MSSPMDPTTGYVAMSRFRSASDVLIMQPFDLGFYQQGPTLEPELFIQYNRMRLVERLDSDGLHALFDNYTTKSERKKHKKSEERVTSKGVMEKGRGGHHINYDCDKSHKRHEKEYVPSPKKHSPPQTPNNPQNQPVPKASTPSQRKQKVRVLCYSCRDEIEVSSKLRKEKRVCAANSKVCKSHK